LLGDLSNADNEQPKVADFDDGSMLVDGAMSIYDAQVLLELETLPDGDFNTLAGFVLFLFARIPAVGDQVDWDDWRFEVSDVDGLRLNKILARRIIATGATTSAPVG
jgi:putative hemolysin